MSDDRRLAKECLDHAKRALFAAMCYEVLAEALGTAGRNDWP